MKAKISPRSLSVIIAAIVLAYFASFPLIHSYVSKGGSWSDRSGDWDWYLALFRPSIWLAENVELYFNYYEFCNSLHPDFNARGFEFLRQVHFE